VNDGEVEYQTVYAMATKAAFTIDSEIKSADVLEKHSSHDMHQGATEKKTTTLTGLKYWAQRLAVETGGIERVTDSERAQNTSKVWNACTFWSVYNLRIPQSPCTQL
jgi:hypothetical protein